MARSRIEREATTVASLRLRVPTSLAVAVVGVSTMLTSFVGCQEESMPDPVDAGILDRVRDAGADDAGVPPADGDGPPPDAPDH